MTTMLRRTGPLAARVLWLATVGFAGLGLFGWAQLGFRALPVSLGSGANIVLATAVVGLTYATVGILIVDRRPDNTIGWLFLAIGFGVSAILPVDVLVASAHVVLRPVPETTLLLAWWTSTSTLPIASTLVIAIVILFPTGRPIGRRWWSVIALAALGSFFVWIAAAIRPSGLIWFPSLGNPFAVPELASVLGMLTMVGVVLEIGVLALAMASVVLRFRRADPALRAQMKWAGGAIVLAAVSGVPVILLRYTAIQWLGSAEAFLTLAIVGQGLVPVAVGIAVLHYHLYDIELLLDRSLVYLPLLGLLGGLYAGSVALSQRAFVALTGDTSDVAIIVSSLLIAWVFTPLRKILEGLVERHIRAAKPTTAQVHQDRQVEVAALEQEVQSLEWRLERLEAAAAFGA